VLKDLGELNISAGTGTAANAWGATVRLADVYGPSALSETLHWMQLLPARPST
jgi:hypothetical protein